MLFTLLIDLVLLMMHFKIGFFTDGEVIGPETIKISSTWVIIRSVYKAYQFTVWTGLIIISFVVFGKV